MAKEPALGVEVIAKFSAPGESKVRVQVCLLYFFFFFYVLMSWGPTGGQQTEYNT